MGGMGKSLGNKFPPALIAACTCCSAMSKVSAKENLSVMTEAPPELTELISSKPGI